MSCIAQAGSYQVQGISFSWKYVCDGSNGVHDSLTGTNDKDLIRGGTGNDTLSGGNNNDILSGTNSNISTNSDIDKLKGGSGYDLFVIGGSTGNYYNGSGYAVIQDYQHNVDFIRLTKMKDINVTSRIYPSIGSDNTKDTLIASSSNLQVIIQDQTFTEDALMDTGRLIFV